MMMDYMLWPWFQRFPLLHERGFIFNNDNELPKLAAWMTLMASNDAVKKTNVSITSLKKFYDDYYQGVSNYDIE
jgi:hypothetical protein